MISSDEVRHDIVLMQEYVTQFRVLPYEWQEIDSISIIGMKRGARLVHLRVPRDRCRWYWNIINFIDSAISGGGKILVNCHLGVSRSPTCVLAYLITKHNMTVAQAVDQVTK